MRRKLWRWVLWTVSGLALLLVVGAAGAWWYTQTDQFRSLLRVRLVAAVNDALNGTLDFSEVSGSIWRGVTFHDVTLVHEGTRVFSAPAISIELGIVGQILPLVTASTVHVGTIEIVEPELRVYQDENKNWNILHILKERESDDPARFRVYLDEIKVRNGRVGVTTVDRKQAEITALSLKGNVALLHTGTELNVDHLNFALASPQLPSLSWASAFVLKNDAETSLLDIRRLHLSTSASQVKIAGSVRDLTNPQFALTIEIPRGSAKEIQRLIPALPLRQDIAARLRASGPTSKLELSGTVRAADGEIATSATADLNAGPTVRGSLELKQFALDKVLVIAGFRGRANGQVAFTASPQEPLEASARLALSEVAIQEWELGQVAVSGRLADKNVDFTARVTNSGGNADLKGAVTLTETPAYEVTVSARQLDLKKAAGEKAPLTAKINLDAWVKGRGSNPESMDLDTRVTLLPSEVAGVRIQRGNAEATVRDGAVTVREARFVADGTTLSAKGKIGSLKKEATGTIAFSLNATDVGRWSRLAGLDMSGRAAVAGTVAGSLKSPRAEGNATLNDLKVAQAYVQNGTILWGLARTDRGRWRGQAKIGAKHVKAAIPLRSLEADLSVEGVEPATIDAQITARDLDQRVHRIKSRIVHARSRTDVTLQELSLHLINGTWRNPRPARILVEGKRVTVEDFLLQQGAQNVRANGITGWDGPQDLYVQVSRFPLEDLRAYLREAPTLGGALSLALRIKGSAVQPVIEGSVKAESLTVAGQPYAGLTGEVSYDKERLGVDLRLMQDRSHELTAQGTLPVYLGWGGAKSLAVNGDANLRISSAGLSPSFLALFTKEVDQLQGILSMDIYLRGPINALAPRGRIQFRNGGARVVPANLALKNIELRANVTPEGIEIVQLGASSGEGRLIGTGRLDLKQYTVTGMGMTLSADRFQVTQTREYRATASGNLALSGTLPQPVVRGTLAVKGTLRPHLAPMKRGGLAAQDQTIVVVRNQAELAARREDEKEAAKATNSSAKDKKTSTLFRQLTLDVSVQVSRDTWLHLDEGSMELTGDVRVRKQPKQDIVLTGNLQGLHGWYSFQGKRFRIEKAEAEFTGGSRINPALDIVARYRIPDYQIFVVVGGNLDKPTLALRSEPQLEQADILSVLLFGKPVNALSQGEQNALQTQALKATAGYFASGLTQSVAQRLGVDTLEFGVGDNLTQGQVEVGKYVREDIFVSTTQQFGGEGEQEYAVEYEVAPNWEVRSSITSQGKSGIDLFWKKQY